ncbi:MAG TPA: ankyrin repeat domain-containing protein [Sphingomonas sp.]|nr:ankyrin repeat domain-containing protein [Sphingomonas sp.]
MGMSGVRLKTIITGAALALAVPAAAQLGFSQSYTFLKAVRDSDAKTISEMLTKAGIGSVIINTKSQDTGDTALHIVTKRRDLTYLNFLLSRGADPDVKNNADLSPLYMATQLRWAEGVSVLLDRRAKPDLPSALGATALTRAVQNYDSTIVALLLRAGANPLKAEAGSGLSARDYAARDPRAANILRMIDEAKPKPKANYGPN